MIVVIVIVVIVTIVIVTVVRVRVVVVTVLIVTVVILTVIIMAVVIVRVGEARKQDNRLVEAVTTHNTTVPTMKLTGKDHKHIEDPKIGPKRRALVGANEGPNVRVSYMVAKVLYSASDMEESKYECQSSEGLQAKIEALNDKLHKEAFDVDDDFPKEERFLVAGSLDFSNMYGSFRASESAAIVRRRLEHGKSTIEVNELELARFLFVVLDDEEIES